VLSTEAVEPLWLEVRDVFFDRHSKPGAPDSVRVEYLAGPKVYREWLCFEHSGFARDKAGMIWRRLDGLLPVPKTVDEALERLGELSLVTGIRVKKNGQYDEIVARRIGPAVRENAA
jgi:DNA repair protein RadD